MISQRIVYMQKTLYKVYINWSIHDCNKIEKNIIYIPASKLIINNYDVLSANYQEPDSAGFYIFMEKLNIKDLI